MKKLIIVVAIFGLSMVLLNVNKGENNILPALSATSAAQTQYHEIGDLFDRRTVFGDLAIPGAYTIVEVYGDECGRCKVIEQKFPAFLASRPDVVIRRVRTFSGRISFSSMEEGERFVARQDAILGFYSVKGTPHIEIYDGNGRALAKDSGSGKPGTDLLQELLKLNS